jgi:hypothetical protein
MRLLLGAHNLSQQNEHSRTECKSIKSIPHPGYNRGSVHDIMLVKMKCEVRTGTKYLFIFQGHDRYSG